MNFYHIFLLLLVILSAYSESPQHGKPPDSLDSTVATVCPNSSSDSLGVLAPVLPWSKVFGSVQSQNMVLPPNEVFGSVQSQNMVLPQSEVFGSQNVILPQNEVYRTNVLLQSEVFRSQNMILPQNEVFRTVLLQNEVFEIVLPQNEVNISVLPQGGIFRVVIVNWQLSNEVKAVINFVLNLTVKSVRILPSALMHGVEKIGWTIRIALECLQHAFKMYTWSLSENQASVMFKCRLIALFLKKSLFRKHDFAVYLYKLWHDSQSVHLWHSKLFLNYQHHSNAQISEEHSNISKRLPFYGGGKALIFSSDELLPYTSANLCDQQYQFVQCIKINDTQNPVLKNDVILCKVPLNVLAPKLTLKSVKNIFILHDMFMPSKILLKNAQILLQDHQCQCGEFLSVFTPHKRVSNAKYQQKWYQNHKEKRAEYNKQPQYQESHKKSSQKYYWSKKDAQFPPNPPSTDLGQQIVSGFVLILLQRYLKRLVVPFVGN